MSYAFVVPPELLSSLEAVRDLNDVSIRKQIIAAIEKHVEVQLREELGVEARGCLQ